MPDYNNSFSQFSCFPSLRKILFSCHLLVSVVFLPLVPLHFRSHLLSSQFTLAPISSRPNPFSFPSLLVPIYSRPHLHSSQFILVPISSCHNLFSFQSPLVLVCSHSRLHQYKLRVSPNFLCPNLFSSQSPLLLISYRSYIFSSKYFLVLILLYSSHNDICEI